ncbi:putative RNA helicase [Serendipita vermifera]|nr:putative RNA helicase [Serendipita vermifera]
MNLDDHLKSLVSSSNSTTRDISVEIAALDQWFSSNELRSSKDVVPNDYELGASTIYPSATSSKLRELISIDEPGSMEEGDEISSLLQHPLFIANKERLTKMLSSPQSDNEISGEIAEIVGFDELDLAMKLVQERRVLINQLENGTTLVAPVKSSGTNVHDAGFFSKESVKSRMAKSLQAASERPLWSGTGHTQTEALPHVYTSSSVTQNHAFSSFGAKYLLPIGTTRNHFEDYEEVTVPPAKVVPPKPSERLIPCTELPPLAKGSFPGYKTLNRIQSIVYQTAFRTNENMLICAPTGAGKTDVAMLTILRTIDQHRSSGINDITKSIQHSTFKIIYVAPMKALASEIVRKLGKRLAWLKVKVRELTGDMQMTKAEIAETQIIVTTPEKWDVVTRKPVGEGELASKVKLLIIDEVHLLNDERGAVIETIVARTVRQVESTQSLIRIVGLSATLPNYVDVADFLRVSRQNGLFFFDSSFRPVPLEQHFLGVKGKVGSPAAKRALDKTTYHLVSDLVREGHQVMVFVHSRKDTVKSAESIKELATAEGDLEIFSCQEDPQFEFYRRDIGKSKNKEMKQLFDYGFGIHHAGMLRTDRNLMEKLFEAKVIKVLACTATLAWGVNLPAHGVIIKGTQLYDPNHGKFIDLSVLDVLQIFGRAGRPGMETSGVGFICTSEDKLQYYLESVTAQIPIESKLDRGLLDALNAEISLGTVVNVSEGAEWLSYTYLFVRMRKNPMVYGMTHDDPVNDPDLTERRHIMITIAGRKLAAVGMVQFDESKGTFAITDIGRIAAKYYIRYASIEVFKNEFKAKMTEADVLALLSMSTEFEQIQLRENEVEELKALKEDMPCEVKGGTETKEGKVNILLQAYISNRFVEDFALVSDSMYVAQNGGRIIRALMEIALSRRWANASAVLISMSKAIEKRRWGYEHPLVQFNLAPEVLYNLGRWADEIDIRELASQTAAELGHLIHLNERHGAALLKAAKQFPSLRLSTKLRPLSHELLEIRLRVEQEFTWSTKVHGSAEPFWIWVEDEPGLQIHQLSRVTLRQTANITRLEFIIPLSTPKPDFLTVRAISDRWVGAEEELMVPLGDLIMPDPSQRRNPLLDLPLLRTDLSILDRRTKSAFSRFSQLNTLQTYCFWTAYNTDRNMLVSAPASSGKSLVVQAVICRTLRVATQSQWIMIIVPRLDNARGVMYQLRESLDVKVGLAHKKSDFIVEQARVWILTTRCLLELLTETSIKAFAYKPSLIVLKNLEILNEAYEIAVSYLLLALQSHPVRLVGLASSLNDIDALSQWLNVSDDGQFMLAPTERDQAITTTSQTFTIPYSAALMKAMAKPLYDRIQATPIHDNVLVFVPSTSQCSAVISDLLTQCALGMNMRGFIGEAVSQDALGVYANQFRNKGMVDGVMRGLAMWHDKMDPNDKLLALRLFMEGIVRVLIVPREVCWNIPVRAGLVVVMGTQYTVSTPGTTGDASKASERCVVEYSLHELVRMQGRAARHGKTGHFYIMCQSEHRDSYTRFLADGLPLESQLVDEEGEEESPISQTLRGWVETQIKSGNLQSKQDLLDFLASTFLAYRVERNPTYYDMEGDKAVFLSRLVDSLWTGSD